MDKELVIKEITDRVQGNMPDDWEEKHPDEEYYYNHSGKIEIPGYKVKEIASIGGEGDGAEKSLIFKVKKGNDVCLFRIDGYYSSWDLDQWNNNAYEVEEYIKQVKDWRKVK